MPMLMLQAAAAVGVEAAAAAASFFTVTALGVGEPSPAAMDRSIIVAPSSADPSTDEAASVSVVVFLLEWY